MIPKQVKVAGVIYSVEDKQVITIEGKAGYLGSCTYSNTEIEILSNLTGTRKEEVFVHELFHAILNEAGFDEHDEDLVNRASKVLYQVLKDNNLSFE